MVVKTLSNSPVRGRTHSHSLTAQGSPPYGGVREGLEGLLLIACRPCDGLLDVKEGGDQRHEFFVEVCKELPLLLVEWGEVVGIILKERRLPITTLERHPMLVTPVAVVADTYVAHQRLTFCLDDRDGEGKCTIRAVYVATVAKRLFHEVVADLEAHFIGPIV